MLVDFFFNEEDATSLKKVAKMENKDVKTYFTEMLKGTLQLNLDIKHYREEISKLDEEFPVHDELYFEKLKAIEEKYGDLY